MLKDANSTIAEEITFSFFLTFTVFKNILKDVENHDELFYYLGIITQVGM